MRCVTWDVRQEEADRKKERLLRLLVEFVDGPTSNFPIALFYVRMGKDAPIDKRVFSWRFDELLFGPHADTCRRTEYLEFVISFPSPVAAVVDLAGRVGSVSMAVQVLRKRLELVPFFGVADPRRKPVNAGRRRPQSRHQTRSRGVAERRLAMGVRKPNSSSRQRVDMGRLDLRVAFEIPDPIVLIIDRDEQDVWLLGGECLRDEANEQNDEKQKGGPSRTVLSHVALDHCFPARAKVVSHGDDLNHNVRRQ